VNSVLVIGAGAMGALFAARLAEAGADVTLVDVDERRLRAIADHGIDLDDDSGRRVVRVKAALAAGAEGPVDLILMFTKSQHTAAAARSVAHLAGEGTWALTLQNGIGNAEAMAEAFTPDRILHGIAELPADLHGDHSVSSHGKGALRLGGFTPAGEGAAREAAELLGRAGFQTIADPDVEAAIWEKLAFNAALNTLGAVLGMTNGQVADSPSRRLAYAIADETAATALAKGIGVKPDKIREKIDFALAHHRGHKASMLQDRLAGRRTEIEAINGAIVRAAEAVGVPVPTTAVMADLVRTLDQYAGQGQAPA
jgi:2-dehydropantoate 2-reductase